MYVLTVVVLCQCRKLQCSSHNTPHLRHSFGPGKVLLGVRLDFKSFYGGFIIIILHVLVAAPTKSLAEQKEKCLS